MGVVVRRYIDFLIIITTPLVLYPTSLFILKLFFRSLLYYTVLLYGILCYNNYTYSICSLSTQRWEDLALLTVYTISFKS